VTTQSCTIGDRIGTNGIPPPLMSPGSGVDGLNLRTYVGVLELLLKVSGPSRVHKNDVVAPSSQHRWSTLRTTSVYLLF
jgi:hypothetical protein